MKQWTRAALGVLALAATAVHAATVDTAVVAEPAEPGAGVLLLGVPGSGEYRAAPMVETAVTVGIAGLVARVGVRQVFENPGDTWVEGTYVFPLPERAAVDRLRLEIGERVIEGRVRERGAARRDFEAAARDGRHAALVEQERPNVFTTSVANVGPGESVTVEIEYQETLRYVAGEFTLRFPMVVGPRYVPGSPLDTGESVPGFAGTGWALDTTRVPDASRITPPVRHPDDGPVNPVAIEATIDAGLPLASIESPSHAIAITGGEAGATTVRLAEGPVPADRDFVLRWRPRRADAPRAALLTQDHEGERYALLMVLPPQAGTTAAPLRREVVFAIDTSGSMGGQSIRQAKAALALAIERLRDGDRFNVIEFDNHTRALFPSPRVATRVTRERALGFVAALDAGGGTEIAGALEAALGGASDERYLRQVVFLTDGAVGNEDELFRIIDRDLAGSRLFTVGIGSAPNAHFMRRAAELGRGTFTFVGDLAEVESRMEALFTALESPVMRDLEVRWPGAPGAVEAWPRRIPDLYADEPLVVVARLPGGASGAVEIAGARAGATWRTRVALAGGATHGGIDVLWARRKIATLMETRARGASERTVRDAVVEVALRHHLASRYTSLVAVDVTPARPATAPLVARPVATNLPAGWRHEAVFGPLPRTATPAPVRLLAGIVLFALAALTRAGAGAGTRAGTDR